MDEERKEEIKKNIEKMTCPLCGKSLEIELYLDWIVYYHPVEEKCSYKIQLKSGRGDPACFT